MLFIMLFLYFKKMFFYVFMLVFKFFFSFFSGGKEVEDMEDELKDLLFGREDNSNKDKKEKMEEEEEEEEVSKQTSLSVQSWVIVKYRCCHKKKIKKVFKKVKSILQC